MRRVRAESRQRRPVAAGEQSIDRASWWAPGFSVAAGYAAPRNRDTKILMSSQTVQPQKRKRGPAPTGKGTPVQVRIQPPELKALDTWLAGQPEPRPSRPEAIRLALRDWLAGIGLLLHTNDREDRH